ncbi:MAG: putative 2-aminoethylphosphonate ABC transporter ATP-binding protein, partial [Kiloniellales bacterium]
LGPSGCGKTTLLRAIAGLDIQSAGRIAQEGREISGLPPSERDFGIVFQSYALFPNLTVARNVAYGLENRGAARSQIAKRVKELLALVGLPEQGDKYPAQLSGGQQQRVAVARALAPSPGLLLLDEPLSALDAKVRVRLRHELRALQKRLAVTTIMVTHDQEEALTMADRIVVMNHGVIEQIGTPLEIYRRPATPFVADFIGAMNFLPATVIGAEGVSIGAARLSCDVNGFAHGNGVTAAIRPEDIVVQDVAPQHENAFQVRIDYMEFMGAAYRAHVLGEGLGPDGLLAEFSINAVRRLSLNEGDSIHIRLPRERIRLYPVEASAGAEHG